MYMLVGSPEHYIINLFNSLNIYLNINIGQQHNLNTCTDNKNARIHINNYVHTYIK